MSSFCHVHHVTMWRGSMTCVVCIDIYAWSSVDNVRDFYVLVGVNRLFDILSYLINGRHIFLRTSTRSYLSTSFYDVKKNKNAKSLSCCCFSVFGRSSFAPNAPFKRAECIAVFRWIAQLDLSSSDIYYSLGKLILIID